jgi:2-desacetyl-2-hydroxyethyl bacteriochlorophyllide A dehydrogenase
MVRVDVLDEDRQREQGADEYRVCHSGHRESPGVCGRAEHAADIVSPLSGAERNFRRRSPYSASSMRAAVMTRYGGPDVLEVREVPTPTPADNEVLVRVQASSVCFGDRMLRSGPLPIRILSGFRPRHPILGVDLAGTVEAVGSRVTRFAPGDAVYGARGNRFAAHAEFACVAEDGLIARKPAAMTFEEAGTVFVGAACALYFLRRANVKPGERVLVHGASGSLGVFAVQLAKHFGAHVSAVCGSANASLVQSLGADTVLDYTARDFAESGPVHDVIVDVLGKAGFPRSLRALEPGGRYLLIGFSGGVGRIARALVAGAAAHLCRRARFITGAADPQQADLVFLQELIDAGRLRTVIGRRYTLDEIADAHRYADTGHKTGNVAILIGDHANQVS